ncbi:uncharacterized protein LOC142488275 [Ascaphus truei]|uniref:uncharacterized protein LOC142488275 n=1 Tax=Ascaphus truei TaxID=8439 RepID=UPI003F5A49C5
MTAMTDDRESKLRADQTGRSIQQQENDYLTRQPIQVYADEAGPPIHRQGQAHLSATHGFSTDQRNISSWQKVQAHVATRVKFKRESSTRQKEQLLKGNMQKEIPTILKEQAPLDENIEYLRYFQHQNMRHSHHFLSPLQEEQSSGIYPLSSTQQEEKMKRRLGYKAFSPALESLKSHSKFKGKVDPSRPPLGKPRQDDEEKFKGKVDPSRPPLGKPRQDDEEQKCSIAVLLEADMMQGCYKSPQNSLISCLVGARG